MSDARTYHVESAWRAAIQAVRQAQPGVFLTGLIVPLFFSLIAAAYGGFTRASMLQAAVPLPFLFILGLASYLAHRFGLRKRRADLRMTKWTALVSAALAALYLLAHSAYFLLIALALATSELSISVWFLRSMVGLYVLSAVTAILWCPRSVPTSKSDDDQGLQRNVRWLPWILGAQGSVVGVGVFLSILSARTKLAGGFLWLVGVGAMGASFMVFFGVLTFYRFIFLALHPIPPEVREEFGLRS